MVCILGHHRPPTVFAPHQNQVHDPVAGRPRPTLRRGASPHGPVETYRGNVFGHELDGSLPDFKFRTLEQPCERYDMQPGNCVTALGCISDDVGELRVLAKRGGEQRWVVRVPVFNQCLYDPLDFASFLRRGASTAL